MQKSEKFQAERPYLKGEVIWGKVKGFPWWPGIVFIFNYIFKSSQIAKML